MRAERERLSANWRWVSVESCPSQPNIPQQPRRDRVAAIGRAATTEQFPFPDSESLANPGFVFVKCPNPAIPSQVAGRLHMFPIQTNSLKTIGSTHDHPEFVKTWNETFKVAGGGVYLLG